MRKKYFNIEKYAQQLTEQQIALYENFKRPVGIKLTGSGLSSVFKIPGTNQFLRGSQLMNQVVSQISGILNARGVHTIDTSPISRANAIGLAVSSEFGTIHVDIQKIFNSVEKQSLPAISQLDGANVDADVRNNIVNKISAILVNQIANTSAHESAHNIDYFNSFPKGNFQSSESGAENFGNQIANQYFKI